MKDAKHRRSHLRGYCKTIAGSRRGQGRGVEARQVDLHDGEAGARVVGELADALGSLRCFVSNAGYTLVAVAAVAWPQNGVADELKSTGAEVVPLLGLAVLLGWLSYQLMTSLPALLILRAKVAAPR